jgi:hypothetical protein
LQLLGLRRALRFFVFEFGSSPGLRRLHVFRTRVGERNELGNVDHQRRRTIAVEGCAESIAVEM